MRDLLTVKGQNMTKVLQNNKDILFGLKTPNEISVKVEQLFNEAEIATNASNRLVTNLKASKNLAHSQFLICNSMLKGQNLGVI